jgi:hypothetical protein
LRTECRGGYFRHKKEEVTEGKKKLHKMGLHSLYYSTYTVRAISSCGLSGWGMQRTWERQEVLAEFVRIPEGKRPLDRSRHRWKIILKWILKRV